MSDIEARIAEVLAGHIERKTLDDYCDGCSCGWKAGLADAHEEHAAAMLAPVIGEAKAEALREAADKFQRGDWFNVIDGNAHVKIGNGQRVTDWLRTRADKLSTP